MDTANVNIINKVLDMSCGLRLTTGLQIKPSGRKWSAVNLGEVQTSAERLDVGVDETIKPTNGPRRGGRVTGAEAVPAALVMRDVWTRP